MSLLHSPLDAAPAPGVPAQKSMQRPFFSQSPYRVGSGAGRSTAALPGGGSAGLAVVSGSTGAGVVSMGTEVLDMVFVSR